jgi:hypothetical protein
MKKNTKVSYYHKSIDWEDVTVCAFCGKKEPCKCKNCKKKDK